MRLIDADKLNEELYKAVMEMNGYRAQGFEIARNIVNKQDTAYDVEKVLEQLQQQANQYNRRALELVEKSTEAGIHNKGKACSYEHAIEIVRKGGVE